MGNRPQGKIYAVGDIHGCLSHLERLIGKLPIRPEDVLVFIGDYIDRGPDSKGVVDYVLDLQKKCCTTVCLMGNHEQMFLDYLAGRKREMFLYNGGVETLISYGMTGRRKMELSDLPPGHAEFYGRLRHDYETDDFIFVHAGLRPGIPLSNQDPDDLLWIRFEFIRSDFDFGKTVIFGHTVLSRTEPFRAAKKIGIDTGAVYGGRLTCLELPDMKLFQVS
ncbi:MAG TPA: metallophosphoesterase family protein [Syntrophales bacterium]|jgi:serine/threonine protein phosphatase 1|nr:metallophosphoesterase family protein [Syntrophales bacterium]HPX55074.1 metallophosphoesterase family protein [Syntrophales bacterium]HQA82267.1 metallophosphoesterase family protein [Syntrophales bacterium]